VDIKPELTPYRHFAGITDVTNVAQLGKLITQSVRDSPGAEGGTVCNYMSHNIDS